MNVDFSKAPDWATGHGLMVTGFGIEEVWFDSNQYLPVHGDPRYGPYPYGGGDGEHRHNSTRKAIRFHTLKPEPWNGEGLPPVGTVCEFAGFNPEETLPTDPRVGDQVTVIAHFMSGSFEVAAFTFYAPPEFKYLQVAQGAYGCFRPIRTPEQIAAEEREAAHQELMHHIAGYMGRDNPHSADDGLAKYLLDHDYRKQSAP